MCHLGVALAGCLCVSPVCSDVSLWCCSYLLCVCRQCVPMCHLGASLAGCVCVVRVYRCVTLVLLLLDVCVCRQCVLMCHLGVALAGCLCVSSVCTDVSPSCYSSWMSVCVVSVYRCVTLVLL